MKRHSGGRRISDVNCANEYIVSIFFRLFILHRLERGTKHILSPHDGRCHFGLSGIRTCVYPHGSPAFYHYATGNSIESWWCNKKSQISTNEHFLQESLLTSSNLGHHQKSAKYGRFMLVQYCRDKRIYPDYSTIQYKFCLFWNSIDIEIASH